MSIVNVLLGFASIIFILITIAFLSVIATGLIVSAWALVRSWILPVVDAWWEFAIAMLDGWEQSRGARIEHNLAKALGIECRPWMEWL